VPVPAVAAWAVPAGELLVAVALLASPRVGATAALLVIAGFTAAIGRAIRAGVTTGCSCFGATSAEPVSAVDILRNVLLAGLAGAAGLASRPTVPSALAVGATAVAVGAGAVALRLSRRRYRRTSPGRQS
jgi:hypothetical protein